MISRKPFRLQRARRFFLLAGLALGLLILHSSSAARISSPKNHRMTNNEELDRRSDEQQLTSNSTASASSPDFVISSLEDEKKFGLQVGDKRHHYDQPQDEPMENQLDQAAPSPINQQEESLASERPQIEARNEQDTVQLTEQQQQLAEQVIIDHRPSSSDSAASVDQFGSSTQSPPTSSTASNLNTPIYVQDSSTMIPSNQQASSTMSSALAGQTQIQWVPAASSQQVIYARQAQPSSLSSNNNQQQFGNMMSASNQVMSSVQYPTSINSIINDQQQQQPASQQQAGQLQAQLINGNQQLVFVPQNGPAVNLNPQLVGLAPNGRRMSISGWLRGLGNMLSNIFYRRDHGAQLQAGNMMMQASGSAPAGNWIQLGPNAPHWLTQAQSAIQQFQQQHQQVGLPGSSRFGGFLTGGLQQQAANTATMSLPQQQINGSNAFQHQQMGDLQTSGSSNSYVTFQAPASITANQPYQIQQPLATAGQTLLVGHLQRATASGGSRPQMKQQPANIAVVATSQQQQPTGSLVAESNSNQIKQLAGAATPEQSQPSEAAPSSTGITHTRSSRSSKQQAKPQQQSSPPNLQKTSGNLPLAHYSQHSASN